MYSLISGDIRTDETFGVTAGAVDCSGVLVPERDWFEARAEFVGVVDLLGGFWVESRSRSPVESC
jgi:hypothetical protein